MFRVMYNLLARMVWFIAGAFTFVLAMIFATDDGKGIIVVDSDGLRFVSN